MTGGERSDEELARLAAGGDERAFSDLYNTYFPEVYDYAIRISRDRDIAALVLQSAFLRLYQTLQSGELPPSIRLQLYASAHQDLSERLRTRRTPVIEGEEAFVIADAERVAGAVPGPELHELSRLAWQAARELRADDYELLDLSMRRGLSDEEIASFVRMRPNQVQMKLDKARATFEESFTSLVLMHYGRRSCLDLDFLVAEDKWSTSLRRRILQHLAACQVCQGTRRAYITAAEGLAVGAIAPAPPGWQAIMLSRLLKAREGGEASPTGPLLPGVAPVIVPTSPASAPAPSVAPAPLPSADMGTSPYTARPLPSYSTRSTPMDRFSDWGSGRGPLFAVFGGGLIILLMVFGALCTAGAFDGGSDNNEAQETATGTSTATRTRTPTVTMTQTSTSTLPPAPTDTPEPPTDTPPPAATDTPPPPPPTDTPVPPPATNTPEPVTPVSTP